MAVIDLSTYIKQDEKAQGLAVEICEARVARFASKKRFELSPECFDLIKSKYNNTARFVSEDGGLMIISERTLLLIQNSSDSKKSVSVIGGDATKITNITSFALSDQDIIVVNEHKSVLIFPKNITGDIKPVQIFPIKEQSPGETIEIDGTRIKIVSSTGKVEEFTLQSK